MKYVVIDTPVERYKGILVKREDLSAVPPAPPFSKIRGVYARMVALKKAGVKVVAYVDSPVSMAGWGIACIGKGLGIKVLIYRSFYTTPHPLLDYHQKQWESFGAETRELPINLGTIKQSICKKRLENEFGPEGVLLPIGLPLQESIDETAFELLRTVKKHKVSTIVVCVGSGTICAGLLKAGLNIPIYGILCTGGKKLDRLRKKIYKKAGVAEGGLFGNDNLILIDTLWEYTEPCLDKVPFPCNPYYDRKAWSWLQNHKMPGTTLFWNVGSGGEFA